MFVHSTRTNKKTFFWNVRSFYFFYYIATHKRYVQKLPNKAKYIQE